MLHGDPLCGELGGVGNVVLHRRHELGHAGCGFEFGSQRSELLVREITEHASLDVGQQMPQVGDVPLDTDTLSLVMRRQRLDLGPEHLRVDVVLLEDRILHVRRDQRLVEVPHERNDVLDVKWRGHVSDPSSRSLRLYGRS